VGSIPLEVGRDDAIAYGLRGEEDAQKGKAELLGGPGASAGGGVLADHVEEVPGGLAAVEAIRSAEVHAPPDRLTDEDVLLGYADGSLHRDEGFVGADQGISDVGRRIGTGDSPQQ
jgi:hypothetical protein